MDPIEKVESQDHECKLTAKQLTQLHREAFKSFREGDLEKFSQAYREVRLQHLEETRHLKEGGKETSPRLELLGRVVNSFWGTCRIPYETPEGRWESWVSDYEVFEKLRQVENSLLEGGWEQFALDKEKRTIVETAERIIQESRLK